jgi:hypothetical protein
MVKKIVFAPRLACLFVVQSLAFAAGSELTQTHILFTPTDIAAAPGQNKINASYAG